MKSTRYILVNAMSFQRQGKRHCVTRSLKENQPSPLLGIQQDHIQLVVKYFGRSTTRKFNNLQWMVKFFLKHREVGAFFKTIDEIMTLRAQRALLEFRLTPVHRNGEVDIPAHKLNDGGHGCYVYEDTDNTLVRTFKVYDKDEKSWKLTAPEPLDAINAMEYMRVLDSYASRGGAICAIVQQNNDGILNMYAIRLTGTQNLKQSQRLTKDYGECQKAVWVELYPLGQQLWVFTKTHLLNMGDLYDRRTHSQAGAVALEAQPVKVFPLDPAPVRAVLRLHGREGLVYVQNPPDAKTGEIYIRITLILEEDKHVFAITQKNMHVFCTAATLYPEEQKLIIGASFYGTKRGNCETSLIYTLPVFSMKSKDSSNKTLGVCQFSCALGSITCLKAIGPDEVLATVLHRPLTITLLRDVRGHFGEPPSEWFEGDCTLYRVSTKDHVAEWQRVIGDDNNETISCQFDVWHHNLEDVYFSLYKHLHYVLYKLSR